MTAPDTTENRERMQGTLSVVRPASPVEAVKFETFIRITADGSVTAYNGHVDLGTGIRTALGQIVAEELDVSFARVVVVLGDTSVVPNQGPTIASETIQISAVPLRNAAAQARHFLLARAAERLELSVQDLAIEDRSEEHTSELQSRQYLVCRLLLEKKKKQKKKCIKS